MRILKVDVTRDDIQHGQRMDCNNCPIARAVGRHFPGAQEVIATPHRIDVLFREEDCSPTDPIKQYRGLPPVQVANFMGEFDAGRPVPLISFELALYPSAEYTPPKRVVL